MRRLRWSHLTNVFPGICIAFLLIASADAAAQSLLEFDRWMQKIERLSLSMQRHLKRNESDGVVGDATQIQVLYVSMADYFARRADSREAERISRAGVELAAQIIRSTESRDLIGAQRAAIALARDCRECHAGFKPLE